MKRDELKEYFRRNYGKSLLEQDDPFGGEEEGGDEGGEEESEEAEAEGGDEEEAEEEDPGPKADEEDHVRFGKSLDDKLQAIFVDIESDAIKSAEVQQESYSLRRILLREAADVSIDVDRFAAETARLILNFDAFFDVEEMIMNKARSFLLDKYGEEIADEVAELLASRHNLKRDEEVKKKETEDEQQVPIAVGATGGAGP